MSAITQSFILGWLMVFVPVGLLGLGLWALWRLIPRFRKVTGYGTRNSKLPFSR